MPTQAAKITEDLLQCKCGLCGHDPRIYCINQKCYCCDLEDLFALLSHQEFAAQSKLAMEEQLR